MRVDLTDPKVMAEIVSKASEIERVELVSRPFSMGEDVKDFYVRFRVLGNSYKEALDNVAKDNLTKK